MNQSVMLLSEIEEKDVINMVTGERIGFVASLQIDVNSGQIRAVTVQPTSKMLNFFSREEDSVYIPWDKIVKIGEDVIIVNVQERIGSYV
ncbi:MAG: YlmC/YmxH family sporulation protein [Turicibacter sp.]|nr:YlmC/YmxH family sporulation protein [Turicibacter sp.]